jgi:hypothetical protein
MNVEMTIWHTVWPSICCEEVEVLYCAVIIYGYFAV